MSVNITIAGVVYPVPSSAADTNWAADQVAFEQALAAALAPPTWTALSLQNSWANMSGKQAAQATKDATGRVWLRGWVNTGASGSVVTTLVAGRRPPKQVAIPIVSIDALTAGVAIIGTDGTVTVTAADASLGIALDSINFVVT